MKKNRPIVAFIYDFDGTLAQGNMQEYDFIPKLGVKSDRFWKDVKAQARAQNADPILAYMCMMIERARASGSLKITRKAFQSYGRKVRFFPGVTGWFDRVNRYAQSHGMTPQHFIISSGLVEMIEGTSIARQFTRIYASSFAYDQHGIAQWPGTAVNYTTKTQFMFRVNKGALEVYDTTRINAYVPRSERPVPFEHMIYFGDGATDVPCMRLVKDQGGHSIAVFAPGSRVAKRIADNLLRDSRVHFVVPADYRPGTRLDKLVCTIINKLAADLALDRMSLDD